MPSPTRTSSSSSSLTPVSLGLAAALKIAQEACNDVPIARQILGSAVCIFELAQRFEKNRDSIRALADRSALLAQRIAQVATGRALDDYLLQRLDNLQQVFFRIEAFLEKESAVSGRTQRIVRTLFVTPRLVEQLAAELQNEIEAFVLTAAVDLAHNQARYDGGFRILRDADVRKLDLIEEVETPEEVVTYAKARVDNEIMIVTYTTSRRNRAVIQVVASGKVERPRASRKRHDELLLRASTVFGSHPHVAQFYGRGVSGSHGEFRVMRAGVHLASVYLKQLNAESPEKSIRTASEMFWKLMDATRYLKTELQIDWNPSEEYARHDITVNDDGEPMIGVKEEFDDARQGVSTDLKYRCLVAIVFDSGIIGASYDHLDPREVVANRMARVSHWNDERLAAVSSLVSTLAMTEDYYARYLRLDYPLWDKPLGVRPEVIDLIHKFYENETQLINPDNTSSPDNSCSAVARCQAAVVSNDRLPEEETLWSWSYITMDGASIVRFDRAWTSGGGLYRSLDLYDIHIPAANIAAFESAMGVVRRPGTAHYYLHCSSEKMAEMAASRAWWSFSVLDSYVAEVEGEQVAYLRRTLSLSDRALQAPLFSETDLWQIGTRRPDLAVRYLDYVLARPEDTFVWSALQDSIALARMGYDSWYKDLQLAGGQQRHAEGLFRTTIPSL
ncbi:hypothetical protein EXIGLDRAFT_747191 [Exidia glandulosa HHB12029]|uniref:Uncharacterized protein n=1 Tax=Exidia glandulosa HHB12029 TaxID=1314781 RepID=A0A165L3R3_EXIGL|nr:hypothetical protein EXIGLDRAFT_747191 [Exidia glandulosa HHB12029]